jgi:amino acid transporter
MDEKIVKTSDGAVPEQGIVAAPTYGSDGAAVEQWRDHEDFMTRNGLNLKSFQRRPARDNKTTDALDKSMKTRHLHMIAIGGSIGAGFFVGSGGALSRGVRLTSQTHSNMLLTPW